MGFYKITLILTTTCLGIMAGLFYSFTVSVMPGLGRTQDRTFMEAMQSINKAIMNPYFMLVFLGSIILVFICCFLQYKQGLNQQFYLILTASVLYLTGTIGLTFFGNVPLNNVLESTDLTTLTTEELNNARSLFEEKWNNFNLIRTLSSVGALILYVVAIVKD